MREEPRSPTEAPLAVVTGAAGGIGSAIALRLARDGWRLSLVDRDGDGLAAAEERVAQEVGGGTSVPGPASLSTLPCDVADEASVETLRASVLETMGPPRALVNNAGIGGTGTAIEALSLDAWTTMLTVDLTSVFLMCRAFATDLKADGAGRVVNVGSISAHIGVAGSTAYTAAKGGVVAFSKSLAREWAPSRVTVNVVAPGVIDTNMARRRGIDHQRDLIAWHRIGEPADVAGAVAYLASSEAEFMTGQVLHLNGGAAM